MSRRVAAIVILALCLIRPVSAQVSESQVQAIAEKVRGRYGLPALAVGVVQGKDIVAVVSGRRQIDGQEGAELDDVWALGSLSKSMTATVAARLVEQGKIRWDTTISQSFPELNMRPEYRDVSLSRLLSHHSGLPANFSGEPPIPVPTEDLEVKPEVQSQFLQTILNFPPEAPPKWLYSNLGYVVVARMLERASGKSWSHLIRDEVFIPLSMTSASVGFSWPVWASQPWPHRWSPQGPQSHETSIGNFRILDGADHARCSIADLARYARAQIGNAGTYLTTASLQELHRDQGDHYGSGWFVIERPWSNGPLYWHNGTNTWNYACVYLVPGHDLAVVATSNVGLGDTGVNRSQLALDEVLLDVLTALGYRKGT